MTKQPNIPKWKEGAPAYDLIWFEIHFPRELSSTEVTTVLQTLAYRPLLGWWRRTPLVVFELRATSAGVRWLVGMDERISGELPGQLQAQLSGLVLVALPDPARPVPLLAANVQPVGLSQPLRTDKAASVTAGLLEVMNALSKGESAVVQWVIGPVQSRKSRPETFSVTRALGWIATVPETPDERRGWRQKAAEPLFAVRGRIGACSNLPDHSSAIVRLLGEAIQLVSGAHAELRVSRPGVRAVKSFDHVEASGSRWSGILNVAELAAVLGWPVDGARSLGAAHGTQYPPPSQLLRPVKAPVHPSDRVLGAGVYPGHDNQLVALPTDASLHHLHVVGPTGSGKSTLLGQLITADMQAGRSALVIEPRGDLIEDILLRVPPARHEDVVIIEPGQTEQVVGFNPLAGTAKNAEGRADDVLHLFRELYGNSLGPRSSDVLLHALVALARNDQSTLADLPVLLTNAGFRRRHLAAVSDPLVLGPFFSWFDSLSEAERHQVISPVLNKSRAFLSRTAIRRLVGQAHPRFSMDELFTRPRIVLVNLNTGVIGEETAQLLGALLVTQLWQAMQRRALVPAIKRHPVMVVIDEVQNYLRLPVDLGDMFAQARGLGVSLTVAHQHLAQLPSKMKAGLLANARNRVVFRPSVEDGAPLAAALGGGLSAQDLALLQAHEAYAEAFVSHEPSRPFLIHTLLPPIQTLSNPADLRRESAARFGVDGLALDDELRQRWQGRPSTPGTPIGQMPRRQV